MNRYKKKAIPQSLTSIFFSSAFSSWTNGSSESSFPPSTARPFQAVYVWLTEIPEIPADGSSPWLMMSLADPFLCPPRSSPNPPPFSYVFHDKSHHASLLTLLSPPPLFIRACLLHSPDLGRLRAVSEGLMGS